jgi:hypothetical protein
MNATADWCCGGYRGRAVRAETKLCGAKLATNTNLKAGIHLARDRKWLHTPVLTAIVHNNV